MMGRPGTERHKAVASQKVAIVALFGHVLGQGFQSAAPKVRVLQDNAGDPLIVDQGPAKLQLEYQTSCYMEKLKSPCFSAKKYLQILQMVHFSMLPKTGTVPEDFPVVPPGTHQDIHLTSLRVDLQQINVAPSQCLERAKHPVLLVQTSSVFILFVRKKTNCFCFTCWLELGKHSRLKTKIPNFFPL